MTTKVEIRGLEGLAKYFQELPDIAQQAAVYAINDVAGGTGLTMLRKAVYDEIDFPRGYLTKTVEGKPRLGLRRPATKARLEATIGGRDRPTSLATFATKGQTLESTRRGNGVKVMIKRGQPRHLRRAWMIKLRNDNLGVAIRLRPGERLSSSQKAVKLENNVYLLYGPSVDQVFGDVAWEHKEELGEMLVKEFLRQMRRLTSG